MKTNRSAKIENKQERKRMHTHTARVECDISAALRPIPKLSRLLVAVAKAQRTRLGSLENPSMAVLAGRKSKCVW